MNDPRSSRRKQSALLRRNFLELTQSFIIPLERYIASLMPLQKNISPLKAPPSLKPFRPEDFIQTVENNGPQLTSGTKGNWIGLYKRFLHSNNFDSWLKYRQAEMETKITSLHLTMLSETDLLTWSKGKSEVELVDMVLRIRSKLRLISNKRVEVDTSVEEMLKIKLKSLTDSLPPDLKGILIKD